ncbi:hypothetical protein IWQ60_009450 [Tieghemiomyces parasiticus]|uniref:DNA damage-binding protein CMR1 n=1 Tax=Tieghemiomyces parasiticus TaxID=78921 RepID=A0A9W8DL43_9FUNG|nr:hypothetical protein IWQ60_009450 [Tieghemiomyces parasiticus]
MTETENEYEQQRLENIRRNEALLKGLALTGPEGPLGLGIPRHAKRPIKAKPSAKRKAASALDQGTEAPRRSSRRLRHMDPDGKPVADTALTGNIGAQPTFEMAPEPARKRGRYNGDLSLADTVLVTKAALARGNGDGDDVKPGAAHIKTFVNVCRQIAATAADDGTFEDTEANSYVVSDLSNDQAKANYDQLTTTFKDCRIRYPNYRVGTVKNEDGDDEEVVVDGEATRKVTQDRIYSIAVHPNPQRLLVCAGDKSGALGFWLAGSTDGLPTWGGTSSTASPRVKTEADQSMGSIRPGAFNTSKDAADSDEGEETEVFNFKPHTRTISQIMFHRTDPAKLLTASYDGSIRMLDLHHSHDDEGFTEVCLAPDDDPFITSFDCDPATGQLVYYSTSDGTLGFRDLRMAVSSGGSGDDNEGGMGLLASVRSRLQDRKIGGLHLNPRDPRYLVTASLDRSMRVWDVRYLANIVKESPAATAKPSTPPSAGLRRSSRSPGHARDLLKPILAHRAAEITEGLKAVKEVAALDYSKSVTAAYWDPTGRRLVNTGFDDTIRLTDVDWSAATDLKERAVIRHNNQTGRWLTMFRAKWNPSADVPPCIVVGNMKRYVDIFCGSTGELVTQLYDANRITAVPAVNEFHPTLPVIVAGNASGRMTVWA